MPISYVFDVDGTLTLSRKVIQPSHKSFLMDWVQGKDVYLLTGSDAPKTIEQLGLDLWSKFISYQCSGNEIFVGGTCIYKYMWDFADSKIVEDKLRLMIDRSRYPHKLPKATGNHIEFRTGCINISTIGRNCTAEQRAHYYAWDLKHKEREKIVDGISKDPFFQGVEPSIGGEISIDLTPAMRNKAQVYSFIKNNGPIYFFGDKTEEGGNDYPFAKSMVREVDKLFSVSGPEETFSLLKSI